MFVAATWAMVSEGKPVLGTPTAFAVCPRRVHGRRDPDRVDVRMRQRLVAILHVGEARGFPRPESLPTPRIPADAVLRDIGSPSAWP